MRTGNRGQIAQGSLLLSFVLTLAASGFSQIPGVPSGEPTHEASPGNHEIPFQKYRDYLIVVQGSLGDTQRLNFIIDTGTDRTVIDSRIIQKLHIVGVVGRLAVHDQVVEVQQTVLPSLKIGALRATFLPVLIRDLAFLQKGLGIRIDAVIGLDVLSLSNFSIDYTTKRIVFGAARVDRKRGNMTAPVSGSSVPFQSAPPWLTVRMEVDGVSIHLLLDTAASGILLFQSRIRDRLPQLISLGERMSSNMGGDFRLQRVLLATTNFGETDFGQQNAFVVEDQEDESREFDGLLGPSALGLKQIAFDFQRRTFSWEK
jgi:predicted aspartyl protease